MWLLLDEEKKAWLLVGHLFEGAYHPSRIKVKHASRWSAYSDLLLSVNECEDTGNWCIITGVFPPHTQWSKVLHKAFTEDE